MRKSAITSIAATSALIIAGGTVWLSIAKAGGGIGFRAEARSATQQMNKPSQRVQPSQRVLNWDAIEKICRGDEGSCITAFATYSLYVEGYGIDQVGKFRLLDDELKRRSFEVYTASEINSLIDSTNSAIDAITANGGSIDQKIGAAERRMNMQIANTVSNLPQNLLTEEARRQIRAQVTADMRGDLDQLRSTVQALRDDVDDLRRQRRR